MNNNILSHDNLGLYFVSEDVDVCMARVLPNNPTEHHRKRFQYWKKTANFRTLIDIIDDSIYCYECIGSLRIVLHGNIDGTIATFSTTSVFSYNTDASIITEANARVLFKKLMDEEDFCSKCEIYWMACMAGVGNIPQIIADTTKCTVYAPLGKLEGVSAYRAENPLHAEVKDLNGNQLPQNRAFKKFTPRR